MNFDRLARHYDWLETLTAGSRLQVARSAWLDELAGCRHVLSVGEGHGKFAEALLRRFSDVKLTCVEASPGMLAVGRRRTQPWADRVDWKCAAALDHHQTQKYDAVVTCFFLDCFPPDALGEVVRHLTSLAKDGARWLVVDFAVPATGLARWRAQAVHALMYFFFRRVVALPARALTDPAEFMAREGFQLTRTRNFEWGMIRADVWSRSARG